jgi:DNA invertase Pin-like site-specific DNA recombinase
MPQKHTRVPTVFSTSNIGAAYVRVSTPQQAKKGSIEVQRAQLVRYAKSNGIDLPESNIFCDAPMSGAVLLVDRPDGARLAKLLKSGKVGHLLITDLDRFSRFAEDIYKWRGVFREKGVRLHLTQQCGAVPDDQNSDLMLAVLAQAAQMQRADGAQDTSRVLDYKRSRGEKLGGAVPYGQEVWVSDNGVKMLRPEPREQAAIARAKELRATGLSFRAVGQKLFEEGMTARGGGPWHPHTIKNMTGESKQDKGDK